MRRKLYTKQLKAGQSVQTHTKTMTDTFDELVIVIEPLDDENKVAHLLANLPKSYDMLVITLKASVDVPKIDVVKDGYCTRKANKRLLKLHSQR